MEKKLNQLNKNLNKTQAYDGHRKYWLTASSFIIIIISSVVFQWEYIIHAKLLWAITIFGISATALWWYWTMNFIGHLINVKAEESKILIDLIKDVQYVHKEILKTITGQNKSVK